VHPGPTRLELHPRHALRPLRPQPGLVEPLRLVLGPTLASVPTMSGHCDTCGTRYRWRWLHRQGIPHGLNRRTDLMAKGR
jgi:hypothetical protein